MRSFETRPFFAKENHGYKCVLPCSMFHFGLVTILTTSFLTNIAMFNVSLWFSDILDHILLNQCNNPIVQDNPFDTESKVCIQYDNVVIPLSANGTILFMAAWRPTEDEVLLNGIHIQREFFSWEKPVSLKDVNDDKGIPLISSIYRYWPLAQILQWHGLIAWGPSQPDSVAWKGMQQSHQKVCVRFWMWKTCALQTLY